VSVVPQADRMAIAAARTAAPADLESLIGTLSMLRAFPSIIAEARLFA